MKKTDEFERALLDTGDNIKRGLVTVINNMGKAVALIAGAVAILVTFTDITMASLVPKDFLPPLAALIVCSYIIYFSLEDAGEELGKKTEEYIEACQKYNAAREKIGGEDIDMLRDFCRRYSEEELEFRRKSFMLTKGISLSDIEKYKAGVPMPRRKRKEVRRALSLKAVSLTPGALLSREKWSRKSELSNPEKSKLALLIIKILPSTLCMIVTVSIMLSFKSDMTASDVINSIFKLTALPLIGFKGYSAGYSYSKCNMSLWLETKANILTKFIAEKDSVKSSCEELPEKVNQTVN